MDLRVDRRDAACSAVARKGVVAYGGGVNGELRRFKSLKRNLKVTTRRIYIYIYMYT